MGGTNGHRREHESTPKSGRGVWRVTSGADRRAGAGTNLADFKGLGAVLDRVTRAGDALIVSRTSDGGAIAFTLLSGAVREKSYAASDAELHDVLDALWARYAGADDLPQEAPG